MLNLKKIWLFLLWFFSLFLLYSEAWLTTWPKVADFAWDSDPVMNEKPVTDINEWSYWFTENLKWIIHLPQKKEYTRSLNYVMAMIQIIINWLLWILAFIALIYMIYCGFLVFSSWSDDKNAAKGKKWISTAAIALAWIWISWLIISVIIRFITNIAYTD